MPNTDIVVHEDQSVLSIIANAVKDPALNPATMKDLLEVQVRIMAIEAEKKFNASLARMQSVMPHVSKRGTIDLGKGRPIPFAKWEDIDTVIRPVLAEHGFTLSFPTRTEGDRLIMQCKLAHVDGHSQISEEQVVSDSGPGRNNSQARGSGRSYSKKYLAMDILNIVTENEDDDAQSAEPISEAQAVEIEMAIKACGADESAFLSKVMHCDSVRAIQQRDFAKAKAQLTKKFKIVNAQKDGNDNS